MNWRRWMVLAGLGISAAALAIAPTLMPDEYNWISGTISESAAQGADGAWVARLGFSFALGVIARQRYQRRARLFDVVAVVASIVIPASMLLWPEADGAAQRLMFAISYLWYGGETLASRSAGPHPGRRDKVRQRYVR